MTRVTLHGLLICSDDAQTQIVREHLAEHIRLTRAESGCLAFDVAQTDDPLVWQVDEVFADPAAFRRHQERVVASEWGRVTAGIERRYEVGGLD